MVLLTNLIRKATKEEIIPGKVIVQKSFQNPNYEKFLGSFFEPELKKRLSEMEIDDSISAKVRSILVEFLLAGESSIEDVATALGMSKRSLQRKLKEEDTTFQKQLNHTRELLAKNYLKNTRLSSEDIAYLLGYQDLNSFFRAFSLWTGMTVTEYRQQIK